MPPRAPQPQPAPQVNPNVKVHVPRPGAPDQTEIFLQANTQESDGPVLHLRGHARVETTEMLLTADEIDYDQDTREAKARGNVHFENFYRGEKLQCDHAEYNLETETGKFYVVSGSSPARIQSRPGILTTNNPFYFEGKWAERLKNRYILYNGFVTDCRLPKPWWILRGPKFDIIPEDRAIAYRSLFLLKHVPLFYAPAFYKSLAKEPRKSGFLTPNIGNSSSRGKMFGMGYYWAINRSYDLLYRAQYFTQRGFAHTADLRGKVNDRTDFTVFVYGVNDRGVRVGSAIEKQGGYFASFNGKSDLGAGFTARVEVNYLSSFLFRQSFTESFHEAISSETHSVGYITKHWSSFGFNAATQFDVNFFHAVPPSDRVLIRKLPEVEFLSRDRQVVEHVIPIWVSFDSSAGLLHRDQPGFTTNGFVDREDFEPRVTTAFDWKGFHLMPSFSVRETHYGSSQQNGQVADADLWRSSREADVELILPPIGRIFKAPRWLGGGKLKHVIEPRADFRYVSGVADFGDIIRFDQGDLVSNTTEAEISVTNHFYVKDKDGQVTEVMSWRLAQRRYFDPTFGGAIVPGTRNVLLSSVDMTGYSFLDGPRNYSPVVSQLRLNPNYRVSIDWTTDYDPLPGHIVNSALSADVHFANYFFSLGHSHVRTDPILSPSANQFSGRFGFGNENRKGWNTAFSGYYDYRKQILQYATTQVTYNSDCCGFSVQYRRFAFGTRNENQFRVSFAVSNIGTFGTLKKQERIF